MDPRVKHEGDGVWGDGPSCRGTRVTLKKESTRVTLKKVIVGLDPTILSNNKPYYSQSNFRIQIFPFRIKFIN